MRKLIVPALLITVAACGGSSDPSADPPGDAEAATSDAVISEPEPADSTAPATDAPAPSTPLATDPPATDPPATDPPIAPAQSISSEDGVVQLDVPEGAVPPGTEISITATDAPDGAESAYEFEPDGLEFSEAATLHWNVEQEPITLPAEVTPRFIALVDDGEIIPLEGLGATSTDDGLRLSVPIDHFSEYTLVTAETVNIEQAAPTAGVVVETEFTFAVSVTHADGSSAEFSYDVPFGTEPGLTHTCPSEPETIVSAVDLIVKSPRQGRLRFAFEPFTLVHVPLKAQCVEAPQETELATTAHPDGTAPFEGTITAIGTDENGLVLTFSSRAIPEGGSIGFTFEGASESISGYMFCGIDNRSDPPLHECVTVDSNFLTADRVDLQVVDDQEGTVSLAIPSGVLAAEGNELKIDLGGLGLEVAGIYFDRYDTDGNFQSVILDEAQIAEVLSAD